MLFVDISIDQSSPVAKLPSNLVVEALCASDQNKRFPTNMIHKIDLHIIFIIVLSYNHENSIVDYSGKWCKNVV